MKHKLHLLLLLREIISPRLIILKQTSQPEEQSTPTTLWQVIHKQTRTELTFGTPTSNADGQRGSEPPASHNTGLFKLSHRALGLPGGVPWSHSEKDPEGSRPHTTVHRRCVQPEEHVKAASVDKRSGRHRALSRARTPLIPIHAPA